MMYIVQLDYNDKVIINLIKEHIVDNIVFCVHSRYQDLNFLARGSQGTIVCSAYDTVCRNMVAIKKISNPFGNIEDAKKAYREFKLLRIVNHKYVIKLVDAFVSSPQLHRHESFRQSAEESNEQVCEQSFDQHYEFSTNQPEDLYLVMELVEMTLNQIIHIKFDHERLSYLIYQMFCAFKYLYNLSIIHRDFKPSNIGIKKDCSIKLLDFGLARKENKFMMTPYQQTLYYRSPEILLCIESYTNIADIWSIGCIMGEMITNKVLFPGTNSIDQWERIVDLLGTPADEFIDKLPITVRNYIRKRQCKGLDFESVFPDSSFSSDESASEADHHEKSKQARDLLSKILVINPTDRITIDEALRHPYIKIWSLNMEEDLNVPRVKMDEFIDKDFDSIHDWKELILDELFRNFY